MNLTSLFLKTSYQDCWNDYKKSLVSGTFPHWDYIVLTASNRVQAQGFEEQIGKRVRDGALPPRTKFVVIPDEGDKRVGSGGATLSVIREIYEREQRLTGLRILVIHSGGDSKRVPQYSALGKLFSPVPHKLPNGALSTLFDEFVISMASMASRIREGMLLLSGDVLLLFNPLQVDFSGRDTACISFKEGVTTGKNHGVYLGGTDGFVKRCLQKWSEPALREIGAVDSRDNVDIDTGAVIFSPEVLEALYQLVSTPTLYDKYVNDKVRLSLYADILYPLATDSTLEGFLKEKSEGDMCDELLEARRELWALISKYKMKLLRLAPAKFIHFGTSREILHLMNEEIKDYLELGWSSVVGSSLEATTGYNSIVDRAQVGAGCYLESSYAHDGAVIGEGAILSYIDVAHETIPSGVVVHGLKLKDGRFVVRLFGVDDNPKTNVLLGCDLGAPVWNVPLYEIKPTIAEALKSTLDLYDAIKSGDFSIDNLAGERLSLADGFMLADSSAIIEWDSKLRDLVKMDELNKMIESKTSVEQVQTLGLGNALSKCQEEWLERELKTSDFSRRIRLYYYIGRALDNDKYTLEAFREISRTVLVATREQIKYNDKLRISQDHVLVKMPLRVNFGGGWSDTPPYAHENGGMVLNAAISLNGNLPVEVKIDKIAEHKIIFESKDMDVYGEFTDIRDLQNTGNPFDLYALQKAGLIAVGLIPESGNDLDEILERLGGGIKIESEVVGVPKGSGLGTSSILSATVIKALYQFLGITGDIYQTVLAMEQIMSTGGGWQDQVGGIERGFKFVTSEPGEYQRLNVQVLDLAPQVIQELNERFCLIYTGERRLARNLLRDVVGRYIGNVPESVKAHADIKTIANEMKMALLDGDVDKFISLYNSHFDKSLQIDAGSTNTLINLIFDSISDLIDAKMIVGAGGGGFVAVFVKQGVTKQDIRTKLKSVFLDFPVDVWESEFVM